jgi:hypothetical protein
MTGADLANSISETYARAFTVVGVVLILVAIVTLGAITSFRGCYQPQPSPAFNAPIFHEEARLVVIRHYANTATQSYYLLTAKGGATCHVSEEVWLSTIVGEPATCLWREQPK